MSQPQLEHFRAILSAWHAELSSDTSKTVVHMQDETANHPDPTDRASQETDMTLELRGRDRDRKTHQKNRRIHRPFGIGIFRLLRKLRRRNRLEKIGSTTDRGVMH